jgi:N-acetylglucosamine kinase-like BadF-type ATPase
MDELQLIVGVDVGGSKTHIRVENAVCGAVLVDEIHESTGWSGLDDVTRATTLSAIVEAAVEKRGRVLSLVAGVHGNDSPEQEEVLSAPLMARYKHVRVLNDSHLLILAHGRFAGTGVIAGTGSSATATVGDNGVVTVGGWGWILGDEGGAVGLVRESAREVLDAYDRQEQDPLAERLLAHFKIDNPHGLAQMLGSVEPRVWAKAAHIVFDAAENGSARAKRIVTMHAAALGRLVGLLKERGGNIDTIVCAGGVITAQPLLFSAFEREVRALTGSDTEIVLLTEPPVIGALNLARQNLTNSSVTTAVPARHRLAATEEVQ